MKIEQFIAQSEGIWTSMRSSHSLAFKQFEQIVSTIKVSLLKTSDQRVKDILSQNNSYNLKPISPFFMEWHIESDWSTENKEDKDFGSCVIVPLPITKRKGLLVRSIGYAEKAQVVSHYKIQKNDTFIMTSRYENSRTEERIWFVSQYVRCRSTTLQTYNGKGILQTTFASEIKKIKI